jgi:hypothetical protein
MIGQVGQVRTCLFLVAQLCFSSSLLHAQSPGDLQTREAQNGAQEPLIYTAGQSFASLVTTNPPEFYQNRPAIKFSRIRGDREANVTICRRLKPLVSSSLGLSGNAANSSQTRKEQP